MIPENRDPPASMTGTPVRVTLNRWTVEEIEQPVMRFLKRRYPGVRVLLEDNAESHQIVLGVVSSVNEESGTPAATDVVERAIRGCTWL